MTEWVTHDCLPPVFDAHSRVLILGTMPSPRSRAAACYYGHPQNRFWPLMARLFDDDPGTDAASREAFARRHGVALWDVLAACRIDGAADASIRGAVPNDIRPILQAAPIEGVFTAGKTAQRWYDRLILPVTGVQAVCLPSTSPANCRLPFARLEAAWRQILERKEPL